MAGFLQANRPIEHLIRTAAGSWAVIVRSASRRASVVTGLQPGEAMANAAAAAALSCIFLIDHRLSNMMHSAGCVPRSWGLSALTTPCHYCRAVCTLSLTHSLTDRQADSAHSSVELQKKRRKNKKSQSVFFICPLSPRVAAAAAAVCMSGDSGFLLLLLHQCVCVCGLLCDVTLGSSKVG